MSKTNFKGKSKPTTVVTDLVGFHYERPSQPSHTSSNNNQRKHRKVVAPSATKAESVHASFRFIVSALSSPFEPAWYDPDTLIPWECVECVVVPLNQENTLLCPICLDTVHCPRITKCGHTFCVTCLLRHMQSDRSNALKCPMCMEWIFQNDLRYALFMYDHMDTEDAVLAMAAVGDITSIHPFYVFKPFRGHLTQTFSQIQHQLQLEAQHKVSSSSMVTSNNNSLPSSSTSSSSALKLRQPHTFHHLVVEKGNCRPHLPNKLLQKLVSTPMSTVYPAPPANAIVGTSCNSTTSIPGMSKRSSTNVAGASVVMGNLSDQFEALSNILPNELCDEEARFAKILYRPFTYSLSRAREEEILMLAWQEKLRSEGDTDMLPFLQQAIDMLQQSTQALMKRLTSNFCVDLPDILQAMSNFNNRTNSESSVNNFSTMENMDAPPRNQSGFATILDNEALYTHIYQSIHGDMVFLHPLCLRALQAEYRHRSLESETAETLPETVTGTIVDIEYLRLGATARDKPAYLRHLPAFSAVTMVEIDIKRLVSKAVYEQFAVEFHKRCEKRREKKKQEVKHERTLAHKHRQREAARQQVYYQPFSSDDWCGDDNAYYMHFPSETAAVSGHEATLNVTSAPVIAATPSRFAEITQMHGHFPSLSSNNVSGNTTPLPTAPPATETVSNKNNDDNNSISGSTNSNNNTINTADYSNIKASTPSSSLSLVANKSRTTTTTSSTSISSIRSQLISSVHHNRSNTNNGSSGFTFTLEEALKQSRGKVQSKQKQKKASSVFGEK